MSKVEVETKYDEKLFDLVRSANISDEQLKRFDEIDLYYYRDFNGGTFLHHCKSVKTIKKLFELGMTANIQDYRHNIPLFQILHQSDIDKEVLENIVNLFLEKGVDLDQKSSFSGNTCCDIAKLKKFSFENKLSDRLSLIRKGNTNGRIHYLYTNMRWWRTSALWLVNIGRHNLMKGFETQIHPEAVEIGKADLKKLYDICSEMCSKWHNELMYWENDKKIKKMCLNCDSNNDLLRCSKCKQVYFCGKKCQKECWNVHKLYCQNK